MVRTKTYLKSTLIRSRQINFKGNPIVVFCNIILIGWPLIATLAGTSFPGAQQEQDHILLRTSAVIM